MATTEEIRSDLAEIVNEVAGVPADDVQLDKSFVDGLGHQFEDEAIVAAITGMAHALGETAPLLLIGMVGFVASNYPAGVLQGFTSPNSAMPAQIYEWAKRADPAFYERAWGGIIVLLMFLLLMNLAAVLVRRRFERRW